MYMNLEKSGKTTNELDKRHTMRQRLRVPFGNMVSVKREAAGQLNSGGSGGGGGNGGSSGGDGGDFPPDGDRAPTLTGDSGLKERTVYSENLVTVVPDIGADSTMTHINGKPEDP